MLSGQMVSDCIMFAGNSVISFQYSFTFNREQMIMLHVKSSIRLLPGCCIVVISGDFKLGTLIWHLTGFLQIVSWLVECQVSRRPKPLLPYLHSAGQTTVWFYCRHVMNPVYWSNLQPTLSGSGHLRLPSLYGTALNAQIGTCCRRQKGKHGHWQTGWVFHGLHQLLWRHCYNCVRSRLSLTR